jgi:hypothetical protein
VADIYRARSTALIRAGLVGAAVALAAAPAVAADWHLKSSITEEFTYDNNFRLDPNDEQTLWGFNTRPAVGFETHTPRTDINVDGSLNYGYFPDRTSENSFDQAGNASISHRTERSRFSLGGNLSHATTRTTEDEDTGRNFSDADRLGVGGNAAWSYSLTETVGTGIQGGGNYVTYDTNVLNDYRTYSVGPFATIQLTEKDSVRINATYTNYESLTGLDNSSDLYLGNAAWTHVFHPQWEMTIRGGASYTEQEQEVSTGGGSTTTQTNDRIGADAGVSLTYTEERASITGAFNHAMVPSGVGALVLRNSVDLALGYRVTPLISLNVTTSFIQQSAIQGDADDRNFVAAEPGVTWNFLPDWSARVAYKFRTQELDGENRAYSNGALASISWKLPGWGPGQGK